MACGFGDWPPLTGGRVGDESAEPGDRRGTGMDIPRTKDPGMALMGLIVVLASVLSIQRALARQAAGAKRKSPVTGLDIAACGVGGGSQTSHPQAACPAAPLQPFAYLDSSAVIWTWLPVYASVM